MNGREALREAARLETARVYGGVVAEHKQPRSVMAARAEAEIEATWHGTDPILTALHAGLTTTEVMRRTGATYRTVQRARAGLESRGEFDGRVSKSRGNRTTKRVRKDAD